MERSSPGEGTPEIDSLIYEFFFFGQDCQMSNQMPAQLCPCGSSLSYSSCCEPYVTGRTQAPTAEKLMRSRYTAYAVGNIDYIENTLAPEARTDFDPKSAREWSESSTWTGLEIIHADTHNVEFKAYFKQKDEEYVHHERSTFRQDPATKQWFFVDGQIVNQPVVRSQPKAGRNDPCPCGSGKKFKKCCGLK